MSLPVVNREEDARERLPLVLHVGRVQRVLWGLLGIVSLLGLLAELVRNLWHPPALERVISLLSLSYEGNAPTWYASALLLSCGLLLTFIAASAPRTRARHRGHWGLLALAFYYISLDEAVTLHEQMNDWLELGGIFHFSWVIPAGVLVCVLGLAYLPFLRALPARTRRQFILAGAIYVFGALVMELPLGFWAERFGDDNLGYSLIDFVEETLELAGVTLFLGALLEHIHAQHGGLRLERESDLAA